MMRALHKVTLPIETFLAVMLVLASCNARDLHPAEAITVGIPWLEQNALLFVADDQGFFAQNNLAVTLKQYDSGPAAMDALDRGHVDIAGTSEYPFVRAVINKKAMKIIACADRFENDFIVTRKAQGIEKVADLKGKRIGVTQGTINEFFLGRFLELNGIALQAVTPVNLPPGQFVQAVTDGRVDAIVAWEPYVHKIEQAAPGAVAWPVQNGQQVFGLLSSRSDWLSAHPDAAARFLKALAQAEEFLNRSPDRAKAIVQKRLQYDDAYMTAVWPDHQFSLTLDHSLIVAMADEARWVIKNGLSKETQSPDFLTSIYLDGMNAVRPGAVEIRP